MFKYFSKMLMEPSYTSGFNKKEEVIDNAHGIKTIVIHDDKVAEELYKLCCEEDACEYAVFVRIRHNDVAFSIRVHNIDAVMFKTHDGKRVRREPSSQIISVEIYREDQFFLIVPTFEPTSKGLLQKTIKRFF
jgi:hypothetical protein